MKKIVLLAAIGMGISIAACSKLKESPDPISKVQDPPVSDSKDFISDFTSTEDFFSSNQAATQNFSGNSDQTINVTTKGDIQIQIDPSTLTDLGGNLVTGNVDIAIQEYSKYDAMLKDQISTATTDNILLESAGMYNIQVTQAGQPLRLKEGTSYSVSFPTNDPAMRAYSGVKQADGSIAWQEESQWLRPVDSNTMRLKFTPDSFRYVNCDKPILVNDPVNVTFTMDPADEKEWYSANIYLKSYRTATQVYKQNDGAISVHPNFQLPNNETALVTFLFVRDNYFYWYDTTIVLGQASNITIPKMERLSKVEYQQKLAYLNNF